MSLQEKAGNLKDRPHEEKRAVAGGIAIAVVAMLILAWGFVFLRKVRNAPVPSLENSTVPADQFNLNIFDSAGQGGSNETDIRNLRDSAAQDAAGVPTYQTAGSVSADEGSPFGSPSGY